MSVTRYRVSAARHPDCIVPIMPDVRADSRAGLAEFNGDPERVHLLVNLPPTAAISRLARSLTGVSSRRLRQEFPGLRHYYWRARRLRSGSHVAGLAGEAPISVLRQYTEQQDPPARPRPGSVRPHHRPEDRRTSGHIGSTRRRPAGRRPAVLPLGLTKLEGQYAINVPAVMAAVLLSVLPLVILFIVMRKQVMRSLGSVVMR